MVIFSLRFSVVCLFVRILPPLPLRSGWLFLRSWFLSNRWRCSPEAFGSAACSHEMAFVNRSVVQELAQGHLPARFALFLQTCSGHWDAPVPRCEPRGSQRLPSPPNLLLSAPGEALLLLTFSSYWLSELLGFPCLALFCFLTQDFFSSPYFSAFTSSPSRSLLGAK